MARLTSLTFIGGLLVLIALVALIAHWMGRPTYLRVAVGPEGTEMNRLMTLIQQAQLRERSPIRFTPVVRNTPQEASQALSGGQVDLAVLRSDGNFPTNAQVVAIWQRNPLVLVVKKDSNIQRWSDLSAKKVAIIGRTPANVALMQRVLRNSDIDPRSVEDVQGTPMNAGELMLNNAVDAVFLVGPANARPIRDTMSQLGRVIGYDKLKLVPIKEAEAMAERVNAFEPVEIVIGAFSINPAFPEETVTSVQVTHFLVASRDVPDSTIGALTEQIFLQKQAIATLEGSASRIEAADTEKDAAFPVHPGAQAYYTGTQKTFMERYSDLLYLGIFALSLGGSGIAGIATYMNAAKRRKNREVLHDIVHLVRAVRQAPDGETLDHVNLLADEVFAGAIERSSHGDFDNGEFASISMALDHLRAVIADRRRALQLEVMVQESEYVPLGGQS